MSGSNVWRWTAALGLLLAGGTAAGAGSKPKRLPNVVLVFTDDQGYGDVGCFGAKGFRTPNLDRMAREGVRFTDFYVAQAVCSASRTAILTGCYPNRVGIKGALAPQHRIGIHAEETTLGELFKSRGYATAAYGKWHLGHHPQFLPTRHGFDEYYGLPYSNDMWPKHPTAKFPPLPLIEGEKTIAENPDQHRLTSDYTDRAVSFIERNRQKPFFLYLPYSMPHVPIYASDRYLGKSEQGIYGDVIEEIDGSVGRVLGTLKRNGLDRDTLVVFTTDNGPWLSYGNHAGSRGNFREGKGTSFEGGVRVPFIARWPGKLPSGKVVHTPAMTLDLFPTFAAQIGADLPKRKIDGKDIWPLLTAQKNAASPQEAYYFYWNEGLEAIRSGQWKLHFPHPYAHLESAGADGRPGRYVNQKIGEELFDLQADPGETTNVADRHPEVVARLRSLAEGMRADLGDSLTGRKGTGVREVGQLPPATTLPAGQ